MTAVAPPPGIVTAIPEALLTGFGGAPGGFGPDEVEVYLERLGIGDDLGMVSQEAERYAWASACACLLTPKAPGEEPAAGVQSRPPDEPASSAVIQQPVRGAAEAAEPPTPAPSPPPPVEAPSPDELGAIVEDRAERAAAIAAALEPPPLPKPPATPMTVTISDHPLGLFGQPVPPETPANQGIATP